MTHLVGLELQNWVCFAGEQKVKLEPGVYALVASTEGDPERSNWRGKSSVLNAIDFALHGRLPKSIRLEDDWITHGEREGWVRVPLSNGMRIERRRVRGKSTQLTVTCAGGEVLARDEAQAAITEVIGLTPDDFVATCYFRQRQMSRFVLCDPGERMEIVTSWLRLEPVQRCEASTRENIARLQDQLTTLETSKATATKYLADLMAVAGDEGFETAIAKQREVVERADGVVAGLEAELDRNAGWREDAKKAAEYKRVCESGAAVKARIDKRPAVATLKEDVEKARAVHNEAVAAARSSLQEREQKNRLARGEFDGKCPVGAIECPAKDELNAPRRRNLKLYNEANSFHEQKEAARREAEAKLRAAEDRMREADRDGSEYKRLRERAIELKPGHVRIEKDGAPPDVTEIDLKLTRARTEASDQRADLATLVRSSKTAKEQSDLIATRTEEIAAVRKVVDTHREALVLFGRNGVQRRIAEGALGDIEEGANRLLASCGIDLRIGVVWSREASQGLATTCDMCGAPFPTSQKVKACGRCSAERGPKLVNRLDLDLTDRSGAAEDLAGGAFQLAASAWLRRDRSASWSCALIDEPFGALDGAHRRAFATHLATMLKGTYGFQQSFIIAHDRATLDALPQRLEIVSNGKRSMLRTEG